MTNSNTISKEFMDNFMKNYPINPSSMQDRFIDLLMVEIPSIEFLLEVPDTELFALLEYLCVEWDDNDPYFYTNRLHDSHYSNNPYNDKNCNQTYNVVPCKFMDIFMNVLHTLGYPSKVLLSVTQPPLTSINIEYRSEGLIIRKENAGNFVLQARTIGEYFPSVRSYLNYIYNYEWN